MASIDTRCFRDKECLSFDYLSKTNRPARMLGSSSPCYFEHQHESARHALSNGRVVAVALGHDGSALASTCMRRIESSPGRGSLRDEDE